MPGQRPRRGQVLDEPVERQVLVSEGPQGRRPYPAQRLAERRVAGQVRPQHQGVDEEADQVVQRLVRPTRDVGADRDVRARAEAAQQDGENRLQRHEHRDALILRQLQQPGVGRRGEFQPYPVAPVRGRGRPRPVERQRDPVRESGQRIAPVAELPVHEARRVVRVAHQIALPERVVRVLDRQRLPLRLPALAAGLIRRHEVPRERPHRPAVAGDVVEHHDQHLLVRRGDQQLGADGHFGRQVEGVPLGGRDRGRQLRRGHLGDGQFPRQVVDLPDVLVRLAVHGDEHGPQDLVAADDVPQRGVQGRSVDLRAQREHHRNVVGGARPFQLRYEPQPPLRE
ncbi:hypothetical protein GCM10010343_76360 [Streptomyces avidinii]|nr:hypothetical protein GCM10010343_76360 [Streptomyces avidinii]